MKLRGQIGVLIFLCVLAYARSLGLPLLEDDYPNITGARTWGTLAGFSTLMHTGLIVLRSTGYWLTALVWSAMGFQPVAYRAVSLLLHIANALLIFALCRSLPNWRPVAFWAAAFFAVHEGHQEAVMWVSANNELLMLLFGLAALWCWMRQWRVLSLLLFALALLSKESAVILLPMFLLVMPVTEWRRSIRRLVPFALLALGAVAIVISTRTYSFRFNDGSFSLHSPFWITWPRSYGRLLWVWGWAALLWLFVRRNKFGGSRVVVQALLWMGLGLIPYSFLTYSTAIPSRQTYLASFGLALLVGLALADLASVSRQWVAVVLVAMLLNNVGYLWTKKQQQFAERAAPTEQLLELVKRTKGLVKIQCFPQPQIVADEAVRVALGREPETALYETLKTQGQTHLQEPAAVFCYRKH